MDPFLLETLFNNAAGGVHLVLAMMATLFWLMACPRGDDTAERVEERRGRLVSDAG